MEYEVKIRAFHPQRPPGGPKGSSKRPTARPNRAPREPSQEDPPSSFHDRHKLSLLLGVGGMA
eukprot:4052002-Pyramimonas_sp.AAC.1